MKARVSLKFILIVGVVMLLFAGQAVAQGCAMCTATAGNLDENSARGLNMGILYLGSVPLIIILTLFYKWYRANKHNPDA